VIEPTSLRVCFPSERDVAEVIAETLRLLLEAKVPVLGVQRGQSLETAFLVLTQNKSQS
jgi:gamma-glutamyl-gamma-aminobutyrate hydrolase PuuD